VYRELAIEHGTKRKHLVWTSIRGELAIEHDTKRKHVVWTSIRGEFAIEHDTKSMLCGHQLEGNLQ
jgi:hypothetical protein